MNAMRLSRRAVLGSTATVVAAAALPTDLAHAAAPVVGFTLNASVLDGGEQVVSLTLDAHALGPIDPASLTTETFSVHAKAESPFELPQGWIIFNLFEGQREVTGVSIDNKRRIVIDLHHGEGVPGGGTLGYIPQGGSNVQLDLTYTLTLNSPIRLRNGRQISDVTFVQGALSSPEVDQFIHGASSGGMKYRLFTASPGGSGNRGRSAAGNRKALVVWLHGGGEGGRIPGYYTNETQLRANRGALGFMTPEAQHSFGGAYVLAPQSPTYWLSGEYTLAVKQLIDEVVAQYRIDPKRVHVVGCSNGGYMAMELAQAYPETYASSVPICPSISPFSDEEILRLRSTPTWFVHALTDPTLNAIDNSVKAHEMIGNSILSLYPDVTWNGYTFNGHWSWIYVARNDPMHEGTRIWDWMAAQSR